MDELLQAFMYVAVFAGPIGGYIYASRRPNATYGTIILGAGLGGSLPWLWWFGGQALQHPEHFSGFDALIFALYGAGTGVFVALCAFAARWFGGFIKRRP